MSSISLDEIRNIINPIAQKHELELVVLFGSAARGSANQLSDLDFAVRATRVLTYREQAEIVFELQEDLKFDPIELVDLREIQSPILLKQIARDGKVIYSASPHLFSEFQMMAYQIYFESKPLLDHGREQLARHLGQYAR